MLFFCVWSCLCCADNTCKVRAFRRYKYVTNLGVYECYVQVSSAYCAESFATNGIRHACRFTQLETISSCGRSVVQFDCQMYFQLLTPYFAANACKLLYLINVVTNSSDSQQKPVSRRFLQLHHKSQCV